MATTAPIPGRNSPSTPRLGLSFIDSIGTLDEPRARRIATDLINHTLAARDGYAARDVLAHRGCR